MKIHLIFIFSQCGFFVRAPLHLHIDTETKWVWFILANFQHNITVEKNGEAFKCSFFPSIKFFVVTIFSRWIMMMAWKKKEKNERNANAHSEWVWSWLVWVQRAKKKRTKEWNDVARNFTLSEHSIPSRSIHQNMWKNFKHQSCSFTFRTITFFFTLWILFASSFFCHLFPLILIYLKRIVMRFEQISANEMSRSMDLPEIIHFVFTYFPTHRNLISFVDAKSCELYTFNGWLWCERLAT